MKIQELAPHFIAPDEAKVYQQLKGETITILQSNHNTGGAFALFLDETPPGGGPPLHVHRQEDETFYLLAGELDLIVGDKKLTATAGSSVFLPRGVPHTFINRSSQSARSLVIVTPAGMEDFFAEVEPLAIQPEVDMAAIVRVAAKYGIDVVGPPMTL